MRAPQNEATGTSGESEVLAQFERMGWGGVLDSRHDTGTDLYLRPRDSRRFELGVLMGAQVKTGDSYFKSKETDSDGEITGWWFDEDLDHFNYWLRHALPHVIILRDQKNHTSYWSHIVPESVVYTGKRAKIFVPSSQTVGITQNEELSNVALTQLPTPTWDGSAWTGAAHLSPSEAIRHAIITPRLIAPHPNLAPEKITGVEALAMQVLFRGEIEKILYFAERAGIEQAIGGKKRGLTLEEARSSTEWTWRATAALHLWYYEGDSSDLISLIDLTSNPIERAATTVLLSIHYFEQNDPDQALEVILNSLSYDDYSPADNAWLNAQKARALLETGRQTESFDLAMETQRIYRQDPSDVTVAAIAGACAMTSFRATGWMKGNLENLVTRSDTTASWWRSQVMTSGLISHLAETFRNWSADPSTRIGADDSAQKRLLSAALLASSSGDHDSWREISAVLAKHQLSSTHPTDTPERIAAYLSDLRIAGDSKATSVATRRIVNSGPVSAAKIAAKTIDLSKSTRTTALADLEMLTAAGDVLTEDNADRVCAWLLSTLQNPAPYYERARPTFQLNYKLYNLARSIFSALGEESQRCLIDYLLGLDPITDDGEAQTLARLIRSIPNSAWTKRDRKRAGERSDSDAAYLREAYLAVAAPVVSQSWDKILELAESGNLIAFEAIEDVRELPKNAVTALTDSLCNAIDSMIEISASGVHMSGGIDEGKALTVINVHHPELARWDHVYRFLRNPHALSRELRGALEMIGYFGAQLSNDVKSQLLACISPLCEKVPIHGSFDDAEDIRGVATEASAAVTDVASRALLVRRLLSGGIDNRASCARILERHGDVAEIEILLSLAGDSDASVSSAAYFGLGRLVATNRANDEIKKTLSSALDSGGILSSSAIVSGLICSRESTDVSDLLRSAQEHPAASIRRVIRDVGLEGDR